MPKFSAILVELGRRHEGQDGAYPQRLRQSLAETATMSASFASDWTSGSITISDFYPASPSARSAG